MRDLDVWGLSEVPARLLPSLGRLGIRGGGTYNDGLFTCRPDVVCVAVGVTSDSSELESTARMISSLSLSLPRLRFFGPLFLFDESRRCRTVDVVLTGTAVEDFNKNRLGTFRIVGARAIGGGGDSWCSGGLCTPAVAPETAIEIGARFVTSGSGAALTKSLGPVKGPRMLSDGGGSDDNCVWPDRPPGSVVSLGYNTAGLGAILTEPWFAKVPLMRLDDGD